MYASYTYASSTSLMSPSAREQFLNGLRMLVLAAMVVSTILPAMFAPPQIYATRTVTLAEVVEEFREAMRAPVQTGTPATAGREESALAPVAVSRPAPFAVLGKAPASGTAVEVSAPAPAAPANVVPFSTLGESVASVSPAGSQGPAAAPSKSPSPWACRPFCPRRPPRPWQRM